MDNSYRTQKNIFIAWWRKLEINGENKEKEEQKLYNNLGVDIH